MRVSAMKDIYTNITRERRYIHMSAAQHITRYARLQRMIRDICRYAHVASAHTIRALLTLIALSFLLAQDTRAMPLR